MNNYPEQFTIKIAHDSNNYHYVNHIPFWCIKSNLFWGIKFTASKNQIFYHLNDELKATLKSSLCGKIFSVIFQTVISDDHCGVHHKR